MTSSRYPKDPDAWRCSECGAEWDGHAPRRQCRGSIGGCDALICSCCSSEAKCECGKACCGPHRRITADALRICDVCRAEDAIAEMIFADIEAELSPLTSADVSYS